TILKHKPLDNNHHLVKFLMFPNNHLCCQLIANQSRITPDNHLHLFLEDIHYILPKVYYYFYQVLNLTIFDVRLIPVSLRFLLALIMILIKLEYLYRFSLYKRLFRWKKVTTCNCSKSVDNPVL